MNIQISLPHRIDPALAADIEKESAFVSPFLRRLSVDPECTMVELECADASRTTEVREKVDRFLGSMLKRTHVFETRVYLRTERRDPGPYATGTHAELCARGWLYDYGRGRVSMGGPALKLARYIDGLAAELYRREFNFVERDFPALVDAHLLHKCGYFDSHPNTACFVGHVVEDFDAIEAFRAGNAGSEQPVLPSPEQVHLPGLCLNPAACFPAYPTLSGCELDHAGHVVSWAGRVFRFESRNVSGLDRLWEFNVREIVFAGDDAFVSGCRQRAIPLVGELAQHLDLECQVETAADPFFATVSAARTFWQRAQEVKSEIMLPLGPREDSSMRRLACGSINLHGNFFGSRFGFKAAGEAGSTGCIGLGIERWVLAAFSQHGFDPARWPRPVRERIFD